MGRKTKFFVYSVIYTYFVTSTFTPEYDFKFTLFGWGLYLGLLLYGYYFFLTHVSD